MDERLNAERAKKTYEDARAGRDMSGPLQAAGIREAGQVSHGVATAAGCMPDSMLRFWLERRRDQHERDAEAIQELLDMLPAKIPPKAESALARLLNI